MTRLDAELEAIVGAGATFFDSAPPLVVLPRTVEQVAAVHRVATRRKVPLTPRAMGSGLSGGSVPPGGSLS